MSTAFPHPTASVRLASGSAAALLLCLGLVGCQPEPVPGPSASASSSASPVASSTVTPTPTPTESAQAGEEIGLPTACEQLYSASMLASLQQRGPLNDPGVTMTSTQNVGALEILTSGIPTIRCTWGAPSETGLATNVSIVDAAQSAAISDALLNAGFACEPIDGGTVCRLEETVITQDDDQVVLTETHVLRGNAWISTATINFESVGYTEDIVATLWG
jgi:hypothetical protein